MGYVSGVLKYPKVYGRKFIILWENNMTIWIKDGELLVQVPPEVALTPEARERLVQEARGKFLRMTAMTAEFEEKYGVPQGKRQDLVQ